MTTESIKTKYDFGFDEGKYNVIRNTIKYTVIGLISGTILKLSIHVFSGIPKINPISA